MNLRATALGPIATEKPPMSLEDNIFNLEAMGHLEALLRVELVQGFLCVDVLKYFHIRHDLLASRTAARW
jgi:hypothetical protein